MEILKTAGVDLTDRAPYEAISKIFNELMDEMERILDSAKELTKNI